MTRQLTDLPMIPGALPVVGHFQQLRSDVLGMFERAAREQGDAFRYRFGPFTTVCFNTPDAVREVLVERAESFEKGVFTRGLEPLVGNGLLTSSNAFNRQQRKLVSPAFHHQRIASYADVMARYTEDIAAGWRDGDVVDVADAMTALTLRIVGKTLFDADVKDQAQDVGDAVTRSLHFINKRSLSVLPPPLGWPTPANREFRAMVRRLDGTIYGMLAERRAAGVDRGDLLSTLIATLDDEGAGMSDAQLRDEVMTIFLAGHETTANAMAWALYRLAKHPQVRDALQAEAQAALAGRTPTFADLPRLPYALAVLKETLRLNPPVYIFGRQAVRDVEIAGVALPQGAVVAISPYILHRRADPFVDPLSFKPERFLNGADAAWHKYAYLPFGGGQRVCIGNQFALMEGQLILATLAQRLTLDLVADHEVIPEPTVTLRPKNGVRMVVRRQRDEPLALQSALLA